MCIYINIRIYVQKYIYIYIIVPRYLEYGIGIVTIFIGYQELKQKTTYIESENSYIEYFAQFWEDTFRHTTNSAITS